ncbi:endonuclease/exonuclease/phosphatase family protein [Sphingobium sp. SCG-1]|uniref:endonuclease/exonuclease/phosphatase family protein n=1 Tax=Sphingobium sp. SCG-1 TaxID=2072936 RepID=UPI001670C56A|nr:endonuclease/exonuclease/phosphatase family protein [Sphingobium sp. SCG-1]
MYKLFRALALLSLLASGASGAGIPGHPAAPVPKAHEAPEDNSLLSVMTYNIAGLPWPVATGRTEALNRIADRLRAMRQEGRQPHIILLQEAFTAVAQRIAVNAGYAYVASGPDTAFVNRVAPGSGDIAFLHQRRWERGEGIDKMAGSGVLILSDYPIEGVDRIAFPISPVQGSTAWPTRVR